MNAVEDPLFLIAPWGDDFSSIDPEWWDYLNSPESRLRGKLHEVSKEVFAMWYANVFKMTEVFTQISHFIDGSREDVIFTLTWAMTEANSVDSGNGPQDYVNDTGFPLPKNFYSGNHLGIAPVYFEGISDRGDRLISNVSYLFYIRKKKFYIWHDFPPFYREDQDDAIESRVDEKEMYMKHTYIYLGTIAYIEENRRTITATYY